MNASLAARRSTRLLASLAAAVGFTALAEPVLCQTTHIVGPGGHAEISDALLIAQAGDTVVVQSGAYRPFDLSVGVLILAPNGATVTPLPGGTFSQTFAVPPGQRATISGLDFRNSSSYPPAIWPVNLTITGQVLFADCEFWSPNTDYDLPLTVCSGDVQFDRCSWVNLHDCMVVTGGHVLLNQCELRGIFQGYNPGPSRAIYATGGRISVYHSELSGSAGSTSSAAYGAPAIELGPGAELRLADSIVTGGDNLYATYTDPPSAVVNHGTTPVRHARTVAVGGVGNLRGWPPVIDNAPAYSGPELAVALPSGEAAAPAAGAPFQATLSSAFGDLLLVGLSFELAPATPLPFTEQPVHFDPAGVIAYQWGIATTPLAAWPGSATMNAQTPPLTAAMSGLELWLHPLSFDGSQFRVGPPLGGIVR